MSQNEPAQLEKVLLALQHEEVIAYPTESVFGLGCDPNSEKAVNALLTLKQRSRQKGLILVAANYDQLQPYLDDSQLSMAQRASVFSSWPGAITWVIPAKRDTPDWLTGRFNSLAVRVSAHPLVRQLCTCYGKPLVSTSANLSGHPPCRTEADVKMQFGILLPVLTGQVGGCKNPSEIRDALTGKQLRQG
ncbi:putative ribosome maturation factor [Candidatus Regiella insecticola LSR1]|uniref:Threonylcarbamoyl-AMP synthase n=1 Tax=Candidatus Regiella insecticola LSR1 TaxID=663321 RepID=E0WUB1_9ENTR|nr:L-threonylcarbamoyladenylate synthase type 1 TsaC [Candidatus Regiella insecticola]EFL91409.1 putative ribosome maturation factor [Candidatus Regiella insecticola LSR1]